MTLKKDYNGKLSDFGLAKDGLGGEETRVTTGIMWTQGYAAPEYIMTGKMCVISGQLTTMRVMCTASELLTEKRSVDNSHPSQEPSRASLNWQGKGP
ncbi:hypothetical protein V6N13_062209 [Hibiscus sabdariffa]|uniref:Protein kinase domain-containing protein n=2 Tax=Hibiscus sabdariffa TaxID=183260 RepID=A0ABR2BRC6_9ROSI